MNTVVNKLLSVDKHARGILEEAQNYYDKTIADIEIEKIKIAAEHEEKAQDHYKKVDAAERDAVACAEKETSEKYSRLTAEMDEIFEKEHTKWEDTIFMNCIGIIKE